VAPRNHLGADAGAVLDLFGRITDAATDVVRATTDWGPSGRRAGQYEVDLHVDDVCVPPLLDAGFSVLSEESGPQHPPGGGATRGTVVVDPLDGSTNASLGLPWCATALCLVVDERPTVAMVTNLVTGERFEAVRGDGARRGGRPVTVGEPTPLGEAIVVTNGQAPATPGWRQFRALGATALDIASVARGAFDGYVDFDGGVSVWDYLAALLILEEAGGVCAEAHGRDLVVLDADARRAPVAASAGALLEQLVALRTRADASSR
jgi:fructose-1,6-bisphosphatase/inositol monophosphatase family enzyme